MDNNNEYYLLDNIDFEVVALRKQKGTMRSEEGREFAWENYILEIKINDYPMVFKFKLDKVFKEYIGDALRNKGEQ